MYIYTAQMIQSLEYICIWWCTRASRWDSKQENMSINDKSKNPNHQWEHEKMKHNCHCIVASLRGDKTFNRVSQITITYYKYLSAALVTQHAKHMYRVILPSVACLTTHFCTMSHKIAQFSEKKVTEHKMCVLIFSKILVSNISYRKNAGRPYNKSTQIFT